MRFIGNLTSLESKPQDMGLLKEATTLSQHGQEMGLRMARLSKHLGIARKGRRPRTGLEAQGLTGTFAGKPS